MSDDVSPDLRSAAGRISDAFHDFDLRQLAELTSDERAIQAKVRELLFEHVDAMWARRNADADAPGDPDDPVLALRILIFGLQSNVEEAQDAAGDIPGRVTITLEILPADD